VRELEAGMIKSTFERWLFAARWLLAPFYVALVIALIALVWKVGELAYGLIVEFSTFSQEDIIVNALEIVDLTLEASLIVLVIFSGYVSFISSINIEDHPEWPRWMAMVDFSGLKLRLVSAIVAIATVKLLEVFMNVDKATDRHILAQAGLLSLFVLVGLVLAISERLGRHNGAKDGA
jgi:uncharacterized protein (TIGR00645 family)